MSDRPNKSFLRWKSNIPPEWLTWASFPLLTIPTMALLGMTSRRQPNSTSLPLLRPCLCSSWQGSWQASLSRRDSFPSTAYQAGVAASAWKSRKKKGITLTNTGDPEISQSLGILPSQGRLA